MRRLEDDLVGCLSDKPEPRAFVRSPRLADEKRPPRWKTASRHYLELRLRGWRDGRAYLEPVSALSGPS